MILNHAAADTVVQWKLCPIFKFHLLKTFKKYDPKSCSRRHCGPAKAMSKFQVSPSQKLKNLEKYIVINTKAKLMISTILDHSASYPTLSLGHCTLL